ncbi:MAG: hypothetical protein JWN82_507 [Candidatus Saccharibacteria bacterium]|nr:hypothetical protein [Candidatus Saccharibacteria bacterium]
MATIGMSETTPTVKGEQPSPDASLDSLVAIAVGEANRVDAFHDQRITAVNLPFGWLSLDRVDAQAALHVAHDLHGMTPPDDFVSYGDIAPYYCKVTMSIEDHVQDWPKELKERAEMEDKALVPVFGLELTRRRLVEIRFAVSYLFWDERCDYVLRDPEEDEIIDGDETLVDLEQPLDDETTESGLSAIDLDAFTDLCSTLEMPSSTSRRGLRLRQIASAMRCVKEQEPIVLTDFLNSGTYTLPH